MKCFVSSRIPVDKETGRLYKRNWRLMFTPTQQVFSLPRKMERYQEAKTKTIQCKQRMIREVVEVEPVPMRCITVDSPNALYLTGESLVPTSNTRSGSE